MYSLQSHCDTSLYLFGHSGSQWTIATDWRISKKKIWKSENTIFCLFLPLFITETCLWDNMNVRSFNMKICKYIMKFCKILSCSNNQITSSFWSAILWSKHMDLRSFQRWNLFFDPLNLNLPLDLLSILAVLGFHYSEWAFSSCGLWALFPWGVWDLSSSTRDRTLIPCIGSWILNNWSIREVPWLARWVNSGNSVRLYFSGLQNHCRWWLQPWN